jgi:hypothetical protein
MKEYRRLRWSRGRVLAFSTQVRGFKPGRRRRIFQGEKILSTTSFGGEVKRSVPCRRFAACKRSLKQRGTRTFGQITGSFSPNKDLQRRSDVEPPGGESGNIEHTRVMYNKPAGCSTPAYGAPHKQTNKQWKNTSTSLWYMPTNVRCVHPWSHGTHRSDGPIPATLWAACQVWWSPRPQ